MNEEKDTGEHNSRQLTSTTRMYRGVEMLIHFPFIFLYLCMRLSHLFKQGRMTLVICKNQIKNTFLKNDRHGRVLNGDLYKHTISPSPPSALSKKLLIVHWGLAERHISFKARIFLCPPLNH